MGAGATVAAVSLVGVAGGPAGVALLAGVAASVLANMATRNVSVTEIGHSWPNRPRHCHRSEGDRRKGWAIVA